MAARPRRQAWLGVLICGIVLVGACGKSAPAGPPPEEVAAEILEAEGASAMECKRLGEAAEAGFDEGVGMADDGATLKLAQARVGKVEATMCVTRWSTQVMKKMGARGVPGEVARRALTDWMDDNGVGGAVAPVY